MSTSVAIALAAAMFLLYKFWSMRRSPAQLQDALALISAGGILVDVRTPAEFAGGHAPGAINVPLGSIGEKLAAIGPRSRAVVVHCASGTRSKMAVSQLRAAGYTTVVDVGTLSNAMAMFRKEG
jgi:phage shock protein E